MSDLRNSIIKLLREHHGLTADEIAKHTGYDNHSVNSLLFGKLDNLCIRDEQYKWHLISDYPQNNTENAAHKPTELSNLCEYYLSCLGYDDENGIYVNIDGINGVYEYFEIDQLLDIDIDLQLSSIEGRRLINSLNVHTKPKALYLGYPCYINRFTSYRLCREGYHIEPILYLPITKSVRDGSYEIANQVPIFNYRAIKDITFLDETIIAQEINELEEQLGFNNKEIPDWTDIIYKLIHIRQDWEWRGEINPAALDTNTKISEIKEVGIYNKAVVVMADRSPYTVGLESELKALSEIAENDYKMTALGDWLSGNITNCSDFALEDLLEVFPMNLEQRTSISSALNNPLTIITGPPGTGKSQVVANLLVNAFWKGKRVLFASKNNKAVDVVEARVNSLGSMPILLRTGADEYRDKLADYLASYAITAPSQALSQEIELITQKRDKLLADLRDLYAKEKQFIKQRNELDKIDISLQVLREKISPIQFSDIRSMDIDTSKKAIDLLALAIKGANRGDQSLFIRIFWIFLAKKRMRKLKETIISINTKLIRTIDEKLFNTDPTTFLQRCSEIHKVNSDSWHDMIQVNKYLQTLEKFQQLRPLEYIHRDIKTSHEELSKLDSRYWKLYLDTLTSKLNNNQKGKLSDFKASVQILNNSSKNTDKEKIYKLKKYHYRLLLELSKLFPCWAVTALSARGRIPFEPGYFDLLIIDEASQCDIASVLPLLYRAKSAVIIGDGKQLKHISNLPLEQDLKLFSKFDPDLEKLVWMYSVNSLFDLAEAVNNMNTVVLQDHHRSHSEIIEFSNRYFYKSSLRIATKMELLKSDQLSENEQGIRWINISGNVKRPPNGGAYNDKEATEVVNQLKRLTIENGYLGTIGVVTPFRAQANLIREKLKKLPEMDVYIIKNQILVEVIHKFQGDEKDVVIFSPVLSKNMPAGGLRFLERNPNLFNVAITRARTLLLVVGDLASCKESSVEYLKKFAEYTQEQIERAPIQPVYDFESLTDEYPIVADMTIVSDWEKILYKAMYNRGIRAIPQYSIDKYILDFALFDGERKLNIEVDGERYHRSWDGELCRRDQLRNLRMYELGWDVMRFWVYEIRDDMESVLKRLEKWLNKPN